MIDIALAEAGSRKSAADLLVLPFFKGEKKAERAFSSPALASSVRAALESGDFHANESELLFLYPPEGKEKRIALLGLGSKKACSRDALRLAGAALAKASWARKIGTLQLVTPEKMDMPKKEVAAALLEGILLGAYRFDSLKGDGAKEEKKALQKVYLAGLEKSFIKEAKRLLEIADAVNFARDLVNGNADDVHAESLPRVAKALAHQYSSIRIDVLGKSQIEKENLGLILAVNRASVRDPALVTLEYRGKPASSDTTALVGKGVTFDTGGLNLKTSGMETMKDDMSGVAAILGIFKAAAALQLKVNLIAILPIVENAIGPLSFKPGDVYRSHSGKTVEITNTDAEGRLILADGLSYLQANFSPTRIIDIATLTGGTVVALGEEAAALFCNDETLAQALFQAGEHSGDRVWRMPLYRGYREMMKSKIADLKNAANRKGSPCTAAAFLQEFIQKKGGREISWAHLDIASTAFLEDPKGLHSTSATGAGVRLIIEYLERL